MAELCNQPATILHPAVQQQLTAQTAALEQLATRSQQQGAALAQQQQGAQVAVLQQMQQLAAQVQQLAAQVQQQGDAHTAALQLVQQQGDAHTATLQLVQQQGDVHTAALQLLQQQGDAHTAALQLLQQQQALGDARSRNHAQRHLNAFQMKHVDHLHPLVRELPGTGQGTSPPADVFPETRAAALAMGHAEIDALANFYGKDFGHTPMLVADRRRLFATFIGLQGC